MSKVRIQFRFLFKFFAALAVLAVVMFFVHRIQVSRQTASLLTRARAAAEAEDVTTASKYYGQYISVKKDEVEPRLELAKLLQNGGAPDQAFFFLEQALRIDPSLIDARKLIVESALLIGRSADAKTHLKDHLIPAEPNNPELQWQMGICEESSAEYVLASQYYSKAFELKPSEPKYAAMLAELLARRFNKNTDARAILDRLVVEAPTDAAARVARGAWLLQQRNRLTQSSSEIRDELSQAAWKDAQAAIELAPEDPPTATFFANAAIEQKEFARARDVLRNAIDKNIADKEQESGKIDPSLAKLFGALAQVELSEQKVDQAIATLQEGLQAVPGHPDLLWNEAQLQLEAGHMPEVDRLLAEMKDRKFPANLVSFVEARVLVSQGRWREAAALIENTRSTYDRAQDLLKQADFLLATCYRNLGNPDQEMAALRRCINVDPLWSPARDALASALLKSGRVQESMNEYSQITSQANPSLGSLLNYARIILLDGMERKAKGDDWLPLKKVLNQLDEIPEAANEAALLRAELLVYEGKRPEAEAIIASRLESHPNSIAMHQALISLRSMDKDWEKVRLTLKEAGEALGDKVPLRFERARFLVRRDGDQVDKLQLDQLATPKEEWGEAEKAELDLSFANLFLAIGDIERGTKYATKLADSPAGDSNLSIHLILFDVASMSDNTDLMTKSLERVKKIEGTGPLWRVGEALRLSLEARKSKEDPKKSSDYLQQALRQLSEAAVVRPAWSRIPRLRGEILDQQGNSQEAVEAFLDAIRLGEQSPQIISRAIFLLFDQGRFVEADEVIRKLQDQKTPFSSELTRVASQISLQLEKPEQAIELAKGWVAKSDKPEDHLWLAQVYGMSGDREKAEEEFRTAISKDPGAPAPWVTLVQFYARNGDTTAAKQALADAESQLRVEVRDLALGQAYQSLNDLPNAEKYFQSALEQAPEDPAVLRGNAEFRLGTMQPQAAEPVLQSILREDSKSGDTDQAWARRSLALIIGLRGNDEAVATARKLLDENAKKAGRLPEDQRVLARILAGRSDAKETNEAISILETITKNAPKFSLIDNALLASLYQKTDDWNRYSRIMRTVMGNGGAQNPQIVSSYAAALVQHGDAEEGKLWLDRLKAMAPNELANMAIEAELLFRSGAYQRLEALLRANVEFPGGRLASARVAESAARRLESDKKTDQAKPFRALATELYSETIKVDPERKLALAGMHARDGEMERVIEELAGLEVVPPVEFGEMIQSALQAPQLTPEAAKQIIPMIQSMIAKNPEDQLLRICLGDYYSWANEPEQARAAYLEVLQKDPNFVPALNNLAMILAATGTRANEAADAIDKAVALVGPTDYLLDTRGIVRMAAGNLRGAEEDLRRSIEADGRADRYFHLALVLLAQGRIPDAKQMLSKAEQGGVSKETLHPIERDAYQKLVDAK